MKSWDLAKLVTLLPGGFCRRTRSPHTLPHFPIPGFTEIKRIGRRNLNPIVCRAEGSVRRFLILSQFDSLYIFHFLLQTPMSTISRRDGRTVDGIRNIRISYDGLARVDGSARFAFGELGQKCVDLLIVSHFAEQVTLGVLLRYQDLLRYA